MAGILYSCRIENRIGSPDEIVPVNFARPRLRIFLAALACACFGACTGPGSLSPDAPSRVDLSGTWKLDRALSDDPEKIYAKILQQRAARYAELVGEPSHAQGPGGAADTTAAPVSADPNNPRSPEMQAAVASSHLNPYDMGVFGTIPRGDVLTIRQSASEMSISDGTNSRGFTPGAKSVVSVPEGVADQHSGWKSRAYVIDVKAQAGPETIERYHLSDDGKQLVADIESHGGNMPTMKIKRVYDRLGDRSTLAPTTD
jgi:hypothetical protein